MKLSLRMAKYLREDINFSDFYLLAVIPQTKEYAVILLVPRSTGENAYFGLKYRGSTRWFGSVDELLGECVAKGYIGKIRARLLKRRYQQSIRRKRI